MGSEASLGAGERFFNDLGEAQKLLNADAGKRILDRQGKPILGTDGKPQTYFSATQAQRNDAYGNVFPGGSPSSQSSVVPGKEGRDEERLERLNAVNGSALPDTTLEETLIGVRVPSRTVTPLVETTERAVTKVLLDVEKAAEQALLRSGGAVDKAGMPLLDMSKLTTQQKGVMGDLFGNDTVKQIIPDGTKIARIPGVGETGIDDLYKVNRPDVDYVVIEYKFVGQDQKTGSKALGNTVDGKQGSQSWIEGGGRIEKAVESKSEVAEIRDAIRENRIEIWVVTTRPDGSTVLEVLDAAGKPKEVDKSKIIFPPVNNSGSKP